MLVCRFLGWLLVILAVGIGAFELVGAVFAGGWRPVPLGELWMRVDKAGIDRLQAALEASAVPGLWEFLLRPLLMLPGWVVFGVPGLVALLACRFRHRARPR